jgi:ketosteroid isomerase-like protein
MIVRSIAIAAVFVSAAPAAATCTAIGLHPAAVLKYICDSERAWAASVATGDPTAVKRILADDFVGVDPDGHQYRKAEMVADTAKAGTHFSSNEIGDVIVRFYGNMAVAQGSETWTRKSGEKGRWVWTDTWLKRSGKWQIVAAEDLQAPAK